MADQEQHVDLYRSDPLGGHDVFMRRLKLDDSLLITLAGDPTQLAIGWATYHHVSEPHTMAECQEKEGES